MKFCQHYGEPKPAHEVIPTREDSQRREGTVANGRICGRSSPLKIRLLRSNRTHEKIRRPLTGTEVEPDGLVSLSRCVAPCMRHLRAYPSGVLFKSNQYKPSCRAISMNFSKSTGLTR